MTVGIELQTSTFVYSPIYVTLLQVISLQRVIVICSDNSNGKTNNVVYLKVLLQQL